MHDPVSPESTSSALNKSVANYNLKTATFAIARPAFRQIVIRPGIRSNTWDDFPSSNEKMNARVSPYLECDA
jgi:hypothetical protein